MNRRLEISNLKASQDGFNLIELMIAILIGLIILSAALGLFVSMMGSNNANLKSIRLNHELRSTMALMTRDIRRAGANRNAAANVLASPPTNPFSVSGGTRLTIAANQQGDAISCLTYSYDADDGSNELYGYRQNSANGTVESRGGGAACSAVGWQVVTDGNLVNISALTFTDSTIVEAGINIRQITASITGNLIRDTAITRTISETVKIRNDEF